MEARPPIRIMVAVTMMISVMVRVRCMVRDKITTYIAIEYICSRHM